MLALSRPPVFLHLPGKPAWMTPRLACTNFRAFQRSQFL